LSNSSDSVTGWEVQKEESMLRKKPEIIVFADFRRRVGLRWRQFLRKNLLKVEEDR